MADKSKTKLISIIKNKLEISFYSAIIFTAKNRK